MNDDILKQIIALREQQKLEKELREWNEFLVMKDCGGS